MSRVQCALRRPKQDNPRMRALGAVSGINIRRSADQTSEHGCRSKAVAQIGIVDVEFNQVTR